MEWIIFLIVIVLVVIYYLLKPQKGGNLSFWKIANKHSSWAHDYFIEHPDGWYVIYPQESKGRPAGDWAGPFFMIVPGIGKIKIYGKVGVFELQQEEFKRQVKMYNIIRNVN